MTASGAEEIASASSSKSGDNRLRSRPLPNLLLGHAASGGSAGDLGKGSGSQMRVNLMPGAI